MGTGKPPLTEVEFRDALRELEDNNIVALYGNKKSQTIRLTVMH